MFFKDILFEKKRYQLAYLTGMFLGDGCSYINTKNKKHPIYQLTITGEDYDILLICNKIIKNIFNINGKIKCITKNRKISYYRLLVCSKSICEFFKKYSSNRKKIPYYNDVLTNKFLCIGLMDSDGWISIINASDGYKRYRIGFKNTAPFVKDFYKLLKSFDIKLGKIIETQGVSRIFKNKKTKTSFSFSINCKTFSDNLSFISERKNKLLYLYIKNVKNKGNI